MQNFCTIEGKPSWGATFLIASVLEKINLKGITGVIDRYGLTQVQREAVIKDSTVYTVYDEPLSPEVGGDFPEGYFESVLAAGGVA